MNHYKSSLIALLSVVIFGAAPLAAETYIPVLKISDSLNLLYGQSTNRVPPPDGESPALSSQQKVAYSFTFDFYYDLKRPEVWQKHIKLANQYFDKIMSLPNAQGGTIEVVESENNSISEYDHDALPLVAKTPAQTVDQILGALPYCAVLMTECRKEYKRQNYDLVKGEIVPADKKRYGNPLPYLSFTELKGVTQEITENAMNQYAGNVRIPVLYKTIRFQLWLPAGQVSMRMSGLYSAKPGEAAYKEYTYHLPSALKDILLGLNLAFPSVRQDFDNCKLDDNCTVSTTYY